MKNKERKMRRLRLSQTDKKICGVCGGIAQTYDFDPTLVRLVMTFIWIFTGFVPMTIFYLIAWAVMPGQEIQTQEVGQPQTT